MNTYHNLLRTVLSTGVRKGDRTGTGTISCFGLQFRHNLNEGFPLLTTKRIHFKSIIHELLWMISGNTNIKYLTDNKVRIWNEWADKEGNLGPVYGQQWRHWQSRQKDRTILQVDQLDDVIERIKKSPDDRRLIVSAWNVADLPVMALPPCHMMYQFYVSDGRLSCHMYQRSADLFLGVPFNIASYALLTHMVAEVTGLMLGELVISYGDIHIYNNHIEQVKTQLERTPMLLPSLKLKHRDKIDDFVYDDIEIVNYSPWPAINASVSV